jgi:hypothetical protein
VISDGEAGEFGARVHEIQNNFRGINVKLNSYIWRSSIVAALGGLLFSLDTAALAAEVTLSDRFTHL